MEAAAAMDFHALSRRELQALCKRNGVRANMTNAAMAEALQGLTSVDGIDEIGTTLCLPTPGRSVMKSAAKMPELAGEEQQLGSPLPRGRRVSVKSPEAIRMEVEEGEDEMKRDLVKEIVKTPGVALRSTSHRTRATPAPLPTPAPASNTRATVRRTAARKTSEVVPTPATLRRSQRTSSRKAEGPVESAAAKVTTTPARPKMTMAFDHEAEVAAPAPKEEEKVQQDEPKAAVSDVKCEDQDPEEKEVHQEEPKVVASDVKCDDPEEEEVTKLLEGDSKEEELEEGEEVDSSDAITGSAVVYDKRCNDPKVEEVVIVMEEQFTKSQEGILEEKEPTSVEKSAPLTVTEDSPILGVLSKVETEVPVIEEEQNASVEDCEDLTESSPAREMTDEIIPVTEDKEVAINEEAVKEDGFDVTSETDPTAKEVLPATVGEDTIEEDELILSEGKEGDDDEMPEAVETSEEEEEDYLTESDGAADEVLQAELSDDETSEDEDDLTEVKEGAAAKMLQGELTDSETSEEDDLDEDEDWTSDDDENIEETEDTDETNEESGADAIQMLQGTVIAEGVNEDASTEDDDFSSDLPAEFDNITISDAETESDIAPPVLEENQAAVASATKTAKMSLDASAMNAEHEEEIPEEADATEKAMKEVDNIVKSLDEFTFKLGEAKETEDYNSMSLRQLKSTYKRLVASKVEGKEEVAKGRRLPLEEVDDNACSDH